MIDSLIPMSQLCNAHQKATCAVDAGGFLFIAAAFASLQSLRYKGLNRQIDNMPLMCTI